MSVYSTPRLRCRGEIMSEIVQDWMTETVITTASDTTLDEADEMLDDNGI